LFVVPSVVLSILADINPAVGLAALPDISIFKFPAVA
jgi:hypothetical protein